MTVSSKTKPSPAMSNIDNAGYTRRGVLGGLAAVSFAIGATGITSVGRATRGTDQVSSSPNPWLTIYANGDVEILFPSTEMGQGSSTSLPLMLAEELDADWERVRVKQLNEDDRRFGNKTFGGFLYTAGSSGVYSYIGPMRLAGAQVRAMLIATAAKIWSVNPQALSTEPGRVVNPATGKSLSYGELAADARFVTEIPEFSEKNLKPATEFRLIGKNIPRLDTPNKTRGGVTYAIDVRVPNMLYAAVLRAPVEDETPTKVEDAATRAVPGFVDLVTLPDGIAVLAETMWAAFQARDQLDVVWSADAPMRKANSESDLEAYVAELENNAGANTWFSSGDAKGKIAAAKRKFSQIYRSDYAYHAQLEPMAAVASVAEDGKGVEVWVGTQSQSWTTVTVTEVLGTTPDRVKLNVMTMGGSFGRRTALMQEYLRDALLASRQVKRPVKVVWTREDDLKFGCFRPAAAQRLTSGIDESGQISGWHHRVATPSVIKYFNPRRWEQTAPKDIISMRGSENKFYDFEDRLAEHVITQRRARIIPWRSIGASYTAFAAEAFMDELALEAGRDPLEFRLSHTINNPNGRRLLKRVAQMANWGSPRSDTALGLAYAGYGNAQAAGIAEIKLDRDTGKIDVIRFWATVDAGLIVAPDNAMNQIEGGIIYGLSSALKERVTIVEGEVEQQNFSDYEILRADEVPDVEIDLFRDGKAPLQIGEVGTPMVAPAIANAFAKLTGRHLRHMPFTPDRVLAALA